MENKITIWNRYGLESITKRLFARKQDSHLERMQTSIFEQIKSNEPLALYLLFLSDLYNKEIILNHLLDIIYGNEMDDFSAEILRRNLEREENENDREFRRKIAKKFHYFCRFEETDFPIISQFHSSIQLLLDLKLLKIKWKQEKNIWKIVISNENEFVDDFNTHLSYFRIVDDPMGLFAIEENRKLESFYNSYIIDEEKRRLLQSHLDTFLELYKTDFDVELINLNLKISDFIQFLNKNSSIEYYTTLALDYYNQNLKKFIIIVKKQFIEKIRGKIQNNDLINNIPFRGIKLYVKYAIDHETVDGIIESIKIKNSFMFEYNINPEEYSAQISELKNAIFKMIIEDFEILKKRKGE